MSEAAERTMQIGKVDLRDGRELHACLYRKPAPYPQVGSPDELRLVVGKARKMGPPEPVDEELTLPGRALPELQRLLAAWE